MTIALPNIKLLRYQRYSTVHTKVILSNAGNKKSLPSKARTKKWYDAELLSESAYARVVH